MIVRPECRSRGIGRLLLAHLEEWAKGHEYKEIWVANEGLALNFYQKCQWKLVEKVERLAGEHIFVLKKSF